MNIVRAGEFQFDFRRMTAVKWRAVWDPNRAHGNEKWEIVTRYGLKETEEGLCLVMLDSAKKVTLSLESVMKPEPLNEAMQAWTDWVFERELLRG